MVAPLTATAYARLEPAIVRKAHTGVQPSTIVDFAGSSYFVGWSEDDGQSLFRTDGTASGTNVVARICGGPTPRCADDLYELSTTGANLLIARTGANDVVWQYDGSGPLTRLEAPIDFRPFGGLHRAGGQVAITGGPERLAFIDQFGFTPWIRGLKVHDVVGTTASGRLFVRGRADGETTAAGLWVVAAGSGPPVRLATVPDALKLSVVDGERLYFIGDDPEHGLEPWISDGTPAGTRMLADTVPGPKGLVVDLGKQSPVIDGRWYIAASDEAGGGVVVADERGSSYLTVAGGSAAQVIGAVDGQLAVEVAPSEDTPSTWSWLDVRSGMVQPIAAEPGGRVRWAEGWTDGLLVAADRDGRTTLHWLDSPVTGAGDATPLLTRSVVRDDWNENGLAGVVSLGRGGDGRAYVSTLLDQELWVIDQSARRVRRLTAPGRFGTVGTAITASASAQATGDGARRIVVSGTVKLSHEPPSSAARCVGTAQVTLLAGGKRIDRRRGAVREVRGVCRYRVVLRLARRGSQNALAVRVATSGGPHVAGARTKDIRVPGR